tara:strand:- start:312 stop:1109 length:798 start_codon:yes stop_codon:yes gene_type:complete
MSNYTKATNFASKDALPTGNALKTVSGTEIDDEFSSIQTSVATKANLSAPTFTGIPAAPTPATATNSTQIATTAFTQAAIVAGVAAKAPIDAPTFTGVPAAPTAAVGTDTTQLATTAFVQAATPTAATINGLAYPVGSVYTSVVATNPNSLLGVGTWAAFGAGRVLVGINASDSDFNTVEEVGGAKTDEHTLTTSEIPAHNHIGGMAGQFPNGPYGTTTGSTTNRALQGDTNNRYDITSTTGGGAAHSHDIVQPYIVVYFWKRTA